MFRFRRTAHFPLATLIAAVVVGGIATPAAASHIAGATYEGKIAGGGTVSLRLTADGSKIDYLAIFNVTGSSCTYGMKYDGTDVAISGSHTFAYDSFYFDYTGSFPSAGVVSGSMSITGSYPNYCNAGPSDWTAFAFPTCRYADFNRDGYADLPIGVPRENVSSLSDPGAVNVLYGASGGLGVGGDQFWHQDTSGVVDLAEAGDQFGSSLVAGDFNGDGYADLAIGVPLENIGTVSNAGAVNVLYGSAGGLTASGDQIWHQNSTGVLDAAEAGDQFGFSVSAADFNVDGYCDLAIGVPYEDVGAIADAGAVNVLYGSPAGLSAAGNQLWHQDSPDVVDAAESGDRFGYALAGGGLQLFGVGSLAVGAPGEDVGSVVDAGGVAAIYGEGGTGLVALAFAIPTNQLWTQNSSGIPDAAETGDGLGAALVVGDFDADNLADLAAGAPNEDAGSAVDAGVVHLFYSSAATGLASTDAQLWHQNSSGVPDAVEAGDKFGASLATGRFDGGPTYDLAIGVPFENAGTVADAGAVNVLYGSSPAGLSSAAATVWSQNTSGVIDTAETGDQFGWSLASGSYDGDADGDLAVGVSLEDVATVADAGAAQVLYSGAAGISSIDQFWHQNVVGVEDTSEGGDRLGSAVS